MESLYNSLSKVFNREFVLCLAAHENKPNNNNNIVFPFNVKENQKYYLFAIEIYFFG